MEVRQTDGSTDLGIKVPKSERNFFFVELLVNVFIQISEQSLVQKKYGDLLFNNIQFASHIVYYTVCNIYPSFCQKLCFQLFVLTILASKLDIRKAKRPEREILERWWVTNIRMGVGGRGDASLWVDNG